VVKKLDDSQVEAFDTEYVDEDRWALIKKRIDADFPEGDFTFLDLGGGTGRFADRLLSNYPKAVGSVLDNSEVLLGRNQQNERKEIICDSVADLTKVTKKYDLVCIHWLLHHLIGDSYAGTRDNQLRTLRNLALLMTVRGRVSLFENNYVGWLMTDLPGRLIYQVTASRVVAAIARRMGANTAGVGVCFLSKRQWFQTIRESGLSVLSYAEPDAWQWPIRWEWKVFLHIGDIRAGHYWLGVTSA
jgi:SAM-dependent methyltransferase